MSTTGAKYSALEPQCQCCGTCCSSAFLALSNVSVDHDEQELARWLAYHGCEPMKYPSADGNGEVLAVKIPIPCKWLAKDKDDKAICVIYPNRPKVCKDYFCQKAKEAGLCLSATLSDTSK